MNNWTDALAVYTRPRVVAMIFLGFSAGLPFLLVFSTLSAWLRDAGVELSTIGFFSWIGITYSIKVFWAPVIDRLPLPVLTRALGKRRSWMLLAQLTIAAGLIGMSACAPTQQLETLAVLGLLVAFGSATQDITIDAYRIEALEPRFQGAMAATYVFGYRVALLVAGAGAFYVAEGQSWSFAYLVMAVLMIVGMLTTLIIREPDNDITPSTREMEVSLEHSIGLVKSGSLVNRLGVWFVDAVVSPFVDFFKRNGHMAVVILLLIGTYKLSDITMGVMANPFYLDLGFSKKEIADVTKIFGFFMTIFGAALGGVFVTRYGLHKPLLAGSVLIIITNLFFVYLALSGPSLVSLAMVISADNLSGGFATSAFIAYLSSLTNRAYTATQYALFSSLMTLPAKFIGGFSGVIVDASNYAWFFLYAGLLGVPALLLIIFIISRGTMREEES
ncbi:MAG: AmpG family muropeptide MFS transporter [Thiotrichales bacterium]|nr:AmpG family muropeptide MFS transporter [Thiotrichales bacterium]